MEIAVVLTGAAGNGSAGITSEQADMVRSDAEFRKHSYRMPLEQAVEAARSAMARAEHYGVRSLWNEAAIRYMIDNWNSF